VSFQKLKDTVLNAVRGIGEQCEALFQGNLLRVICIAGLLLLVLIGAALAVLRFMGRESAAPVEMSFSRLLMEYDRAEGRAAPGAVPELENLDRSLAGLEQEAQGVEAWLSVLKRRRRLARLNARFLPAYHRSALSARAAFPWSEPLAAIAAAAIIRDTAVNRETEAELRSCLSLFADARYNPLRVSFHVLLGDLQNPARAAAVLPSSLSYADAGGVLSPAETDALAADMAMVKLLNGDTAAATAEIQGAFFARHADGSAPSPELLRFAAEYLYDFGDLSRSAELFSRLPDEAALLRQADALWLAAYAGSARAIWSILAGTAAAITTGTTTTAAAGTGTTATTATTAATGSGETGPSVRGRALGLYNLAVSTENRDEAAALLERLIALPTAEPSRQFGRIRYSRLLDAPRAIALLEAEAPEAASSAGALLDLEILRRRTEVAETGRLTAETWLLLGRYPDEEDLYQWAAWFFDFRRNYGETAVLLKTAARRQLVGHWAAVHEALQLQRQGNLDAAETLLASIPAEAADWSVAANLGRILEARHAPSRALEQYERAAALSAPGTAPETASRIQFRIARCFKTMGRATESRRTLEYALDLNPDNLNARLELGRLGNAE
jgi:tetratricopeptide (TPR) repeat protein